MAISERLKRLEQHVTQPRSITMFDILKLIEQRKREDPEWEAKREVERRARLVALEGTTVERLSQ